MKSASDYRKILAYLYSLTDYERRGFAAYAPESYNLDRVRRLLALLGDPHRSFRSVHIAGTKGKGSTAAMIESILRVGGCRTGLYTSPHLHTFRERIQAAGVPIAEADVVRLIDEMRPLVSEIEEITTFEVMTALAFAWFAEHGVQWAVAEVGLGGRLDATNVLEPEVTVITSISLDHTGVLGDTVAQIAAEKAGIVKAGVPVVSAPQSDEALAVIEATSRRQGAPLTLVGRDWRWRAAPVVPARVDNTHIPEGQVFDLLDGGEAWRDLWIPLLGEHQLSNAATAAAAVWLLREAGLDLPLPAIREGLRTVYWPGRLELLGRAPWVVVDSAHNGDSARKLVAALARHFHFRNLVVVLGASADHATAELLDALLSDAQRAIATRSQHPRAADTAWLQARAGELGFAMEIGHGVDRALSLALEGAGPQDLVCCTGSVFVAAEARAAWFARQGLALPPSDPT
jgi:dihydrofolate synthase/folylpolyglutamate synthase